MERVREFEAVVIALPGEDVLPSYGAIRCRVVAIFGLVMVLRPNDVADAHRLGQGTGDCILSFRHEGALIGFRGGVRPRRALFEFEVADEVQLPRRRSTRVALAAPLTLRRGDGRTLEGTSVNLAPEGVLAELTSEVELGARVGLELHLEGHVDLTVPSVVVRTEGGRTALAFETTTAKEREALEQLIVERRMDRLERVLDERDGADAGRSAGLQR